MFRTVIGQCRISTIMENIVENYGLSHVAIQILDYLDDKSLTNSRLVKENWKNLIDSSLIDRIDQLIDKALNVFEIKFPDFFKAWPEWLKIFADFRKNRSYEDFLYLNQDLETYFESYEYKIDSTRNIGRAFDPLRLAVQKNDISFLRLVLPSVKNLSYANVQGYTLLHKAVMVGNCEIVKLILTEFRHKLDLQIEDRNYMWRRKTIQKEECTNADKLYKALPSCTLNNRKFEYQD